MVGATPTREQIGIVLKAIRLKRDAVLHDINRELKMDTSCLSRVERGKQGFSLDNLASLLGFYGLDLSKVLADAAGVTADDLAAVRKRVRKPVEAPAPVLEQSPDPDGWFEHNPVLYSKDFADRQMLLSRRSFEQTEFELIFMGCALRGLYSLDGAKRAAKSFARDVLREAIKDFDKP